MKGRGQERPLDFLAILKVLKNSWILVCGLRFTCETLLWRFFRRVALRFWEITYAKNSYLLSREHATAKMFISLKIQQNADFSQSVIFKKCWFQVKNKKTV